MRYDENGHPVALTGAKQRAEELFDVSLVKSGIPLNEKFVRLLTRIMMVLSHWRSFLMLTTGWQRFSSVKMLLSRRRSYTA